MSVCFPDCICCIHANLVYLPFLKHFWNSVHLSIPFSFLGMPFPVSSVHENLLSFQDPGKVLFPMWSCSQPLLTKPKSCVISSIELYKFLKYFCVSLCSKIIMTSLKGGKYHLCIVNIQKHWQYFWWHFLAVCFIK